MWPSSARRDTDEDRIDFITALCIFLRSNLRARHLCQKPLELWHASGQPHALSLNLHVWYIPKQSIQLFLLLVSIPCPQYVNSRPLRLQNWHCGRQ